jgi:hypothetical protein
VYLQKRLECYHCSELQCYSYSKIKYVIINCNSALRISNKSSYQIRNPLITVALPSKHAKISYVITRIRGKVILPSAVTRIQRNPRLSSAVVASTIPARIKENLSCL